MGFWEHVYTKIVWIATCSEVVSYFWSLGCGMTDDDRWQILSSAIPLHVAFCVHGCLLMLEMFKQYPGTVGRCWRLCKGMAPPPTQTLKRIDWSICLHAIYLYSIYWSRCSEVRTWYFCKSYLFDYKIILYIHTFWEALKLNISLWNTYERRW